MIMMVVYNKWSWLHANTGEEAAPEDTTATDELQTEEGNDSVI